VPFNLFIYALLVFSFRGFWAINSNLGRVWS